VDRIVGRICRRVGINLGRNQPQNRSNVVVHDTVPGGESTGSWGGRGHSELFQPGVGQVVAQFDSRRWTATISEKCNDTMERW
jgi:hypothetical protein